MTDFVGFYRVSTQRQASSGLGLEHQRKLVTDYIASRGGVLLNSSWARSVISRPVP